MQHTLPLTDLYASAYLAARHVPLLGCERGEDGRMVFQFTRTAENDRLLREYWNGVPVEIAPSQLFSALKHLKGLLPARP